MQNKVADAELGKAQAQMTNVKLEARVEALKAKLEQAQLQLDALTKGAENQFQYDKMRTDAALKLTEIESREKIEANKQYEQNKASVSG